MRKKVITLFIACFCLLAVKAQSVLNIDHLSGVKQNIYMPFYQPAYRLLIQQAEQALSQPALSVTDKLKIPASGSKHDYMSQARYFWPNPAEEDGVPYIRKDGVTNPEVEDIESLDRKRLELFTDKVSTLSFAWYFSGDERYAQKAAELIRVWFFDKKTRMNPNLNYAQVVPGQEDDKGRCYGLIDGYLWIDFLDAVQLLEHSKAFTVRDSKMLKAWFAQYLNWMLTSPLGIGASETLNNHAIAYDAQVVAYALYSENDKVALRVLHELPEKRIFTQITAEGKQPEELERTLSFNYSLYNLNHLIDICLMAKKKGVPVDEAVSPAGAGFYRAVDFLAGYLGRKVTEWPYKQISGWEEKQQELCRDLYRIYSFNPSRKDYLQLFRQYARVKPTDRFNLLYFDADVADLAFAFAAEQLRFGINCTAEARHKTPNKTLVNPRTVEKDGSLRIVAPRDWCSGFFPGSLWQMYAYNHLDFWRQEAVSHTWPIEGMKRYKGTHDLGFVIFNSFGQAYRLTGESSFRDVTLQAAKSLASRYNDTVKAIRSWDHSTGKWDFPVIIDNMMNLELLFWASRQTGDSSYYHIAVNHANTTMKNHFRPDYSSFHVLGYNPQTGEVMKKNTHQGISDDSFWSRGQAWGLYGYTMCYRFTRNPAYLQQAEKIAHFFFTLPHLPTDLIPYWDMKDPAIPDSPRDASAAAVFASGLYELSEYAEQPMKDTYRKWADRIVENLQKSYQAENGCSQGFLLLHSTGNYPSLDEIDVPIVYADYYYLEALSRRIGLKNY